MKAERKKIKMRWSTTRVIMAGFASLILLGALILMLPISAANGQSTFWVDALFTSATSVCVTGLTTVTTATHWSLFGKVVILCLAQLGGLGVITVATGIFMVLRRQITLKDRLMIQESYNLLNLQGIVKMVKMIILGTIIVEGVGAICYATVFVPEFGWPRGIWYSVFHSVSAFCNAGLDILGDNSLGNYVTNPMVNFTTMFLIIVGGIGFVVWRDILDMRRRMRGKTVSPRTCFSFLQLHSKVVLVVTGVLIVVPTLLILLFEFQNPDTIGNMAFGDKVMASLFQSVTTRTAGYATIDQGNFSNGTALLCSFLMFIGGSPAGTAGGVKTVTIAILFFTVRSTIHGYKDTEVYGRRISPDSIRTALSVVLISAAILFISLTCLMITEDISLVDALYEVTSAVATVGLTRGITPTLTILGKINIILVMYLGRIGPITMALAFAIRRNGHVKLREFPEGKMIIG